MLAAVCANVSLTNRWPAPPPPQHHQRPQETTEGLFFLLAVGTASLLRKHIQNICSRVSEERGRRLMGEERGEGGGGGGG